MEFSTAKLSCRSDGLICSASNDLKNVTLIRVKNENVLVQRLNCEWIPERNKITVHNQFLFSSDSMSCSIPCIQDISDNSIHCENAYPPNLYKPLYPIHSQRFITKWNTMSAVHAMLFDDDFIYISDEFLFTKGHSTY